MKTLLVMILMAGSQTFANVGSLDGKSYCRAVVTEGFLGQPDIAGLHCLSFENGIATDDANTFFGSPPESAPYEQVGSSVFFGSSEYTLSADGQTLTAVTGSVTKNTVFELQP